MRGSRAIALAGLSLLTMSNSCEKESPAVPFTTGQLVKVETTLDDHFSHPQPRWLVNIAPLALPGLRGVPYQQVKVFSLPDTITYKAGQAIICHYQLVPYEQQTRWRTWLERHNLAQEPTGADPLPEVQVTAVQVASSK
jgi:hypothetical protein